MNAKQVGDKVKFDGREYVVVNAIEPGPATKAHAPNLVQSLVVIGAKGAARLYDLYTDGELRSAI